ncbi:hypothetical protein Sya03_42090 [Spirilliplanes yamanashiensis]|uniref:Uncharacterized protein n=1 Tax=Spirilliplanes yamanashiensis TaxID=42233 RepID=A0A8J4DK46_9ACTN|nr:hypothetical protein Sya03_42090 [Spirilliplanes yamanashiensis]
MLAAVLATAAGGCDLPAVGGTSGVLRDAGGGAVAVLSWCAGFGRPALIGLYGVGGDNPLMTITREGAAPPGDFLTVPLREPPEGWRADRPLPLLDRYASYEIRVWNESGDGRMTGPVFRPGELRDLVLTERWGDGDAYVRTFAPVDEFRRAAAQTCG